MYDTKLYKQAIKHYLLARTLFKQLGVIYTAKSIVPQIGEWLVAQIYGSTIERNPNNPDWDVLVNDQRFQVKTHAKSDTNTQQYTQIEYKADANIDILIIIVFSEDLKLKHFFEIPWQDIIKDFPPQKKGYRLYWKRLSAYDKHTEVLQNNKVSDIFTIFYDKDHVKDQ